METQDLDSITKTVDMQQFYKTNKRNKFDTMCSGEVHEKHSENAGSFVTI